MMREQPENLRRYPRFHVDVQANVRTLDGRKLVARTRDLSRTGICLVMNEDLGSGANLGIELVLLLGPTSSSEPLPLRARVVWCTAIAGAYQVGAMFDGLSAKESAFLDMFLRYLDGTILPAGAEMEAIEDGDDGDASPAGEDDDRTPSPDVKDDPFR